ncbi:MAG: DNA repair protein RecN [Actinomycetota bacterium]|nr:DNA repair protein RecN [Actinomycetota bacterium]
MLLELRIENLLLIERAELRLGPGLNAITGETGAGKTVLAHSLDLLMGGKARAQVVRPGASEAYVEGVFEPPPGLWDEPELAELAERLPADTSELVIARRVGASGRTSAYVQGRSANVADLRLLGARLLAFFGQHEHRRLTLASAQLDVLDGFAGADHLELRDSYRIAHRGVRAAEREITELQEREGTRERDLDLMRFELSEIDGVGPDPDERAEFASERERLRHAEGLREAAATGLAAIAGVDEDGTGAAGALAAADGGLGAVAGVDPALDSLGERVAAAALELGDLASEFRAYADAVEAEPGRLEAVEERLAQIERLERKHGGSIEAVLTHAERCRTEITRLEGAEELAGELAERLADACAEQSMLAAKLTRSREKAAPEFEKAVADALAGLSMEGAQLEVAFAPVAETDGFGASGAESVELCVATNPGMPVSPLRDAASGGELSRIMLALSGLGGGGGGATRVFDEIDAGVGGATARAVGERLRELADAAQVLCITHLPQVASLASAHFRISKKVHGGVTSARVEAVSGDDLVGEIVRMLGSDAGDEAATHHARELLAA